jgi:hypothetical protein
VCFDGWLRLFQSFDAAHQADDLISETLVLLLESGALRG